VIQPSSRTSGGPRPASVDAVIVGAGIAGVATAWQLAERLGSTTAVLVDSRPPLSLTSRRPEANYRDWWPQASMVELAGRSIDLMEALLEDGATFAMHRRGYLYVTADPATAASLPVTVARRAAAGGGADVLAPPELERRYPHLSPALLGAIQARRAGSVDTVALGRMLLDRAIGRGVSLIAGTLAGVDVRAGRIEGVRIATDSGEVRLSTERFVNAAGPFARDVARLTGSELELDTVLRQKVVIRDTDGVVPRDAPFTIFMDPQVLEWSESERRALDGSASTRRLLDRLPGGVHVKPDDAAGKQAVKLGWAWDQTASPPAPDPVCPPEFPRMALLGAATFVPGLRRYADAGVVPVAHDGGFYARTKDGRPLIGPLDADGAFIVGGLAGFGAMMACAAGELAAGWILDGRPSTALATAFDPRRFRHPGYVREIRAGVGPTGEL
jgi:sarcosine oxidase, subunit beta